MSTEKHRLVEALYDPKSKKTLVRHPQDENVWVDSELIKDVISGCPSASVGGMDDCEILTHMPHSKALGEAKKLKLNLIFVGHHWYER